MQEQMTERRRGGMAMSKIDDAAETVKNATDKTAAKAKEVVRAAGEKMTRAGEATKKQGK
jgi:hypothetical protein